MIVKLFEDFNSVKLYPSTKKVEDYYNFLLNNIEVGEVQLDFIDINGEDIVGESNKGAYIIHLHALEIYPDYKGKKLGEKSMRLIINKIRQILPKARYLDLTVLKDNIIARNLYKKIGFKEYESGKFFYPDQRDEEYSDTSKNSYSLLVLDLRKYTE